MKTCSKCKVSKPDTDFHKNKKERDGLNCWCKTCRAAHRLATFDPEKSRQWRIAHADQIREQKRKYRRENPEKENARIRKWLAANPGRTAEYQKRSWERNPGKREADFKRFAEWAASHPEKRGLGRKELRDSYVLFVLTRRTSINREDIPLALIDLKREHLQLRRLAQQLKKAKHESSQNLGG